MQVWKFCSHTYHYWKWLLFVTSETLLIQQNSVNLTSYNLVLEKSKGGSFAFNQKKKIFVSEAGRSHRHVQQGLQECL